MIGTSDEIHRKFFKEVLEKKTSEVENELHEASEGMRKLTVERKAEAGVAEGFCHVQGRLEPGTSDGDRSSVGSASGLH